MTDWKEIAQNIKNICSPFLNESGYPEGKNRFFRGSSRPVDPALPIEVRKDRKPKSTPAELHDAADKWFAENLGTPYRSGSLFCTGSDKIASKHGDVILVFPIGGYSFCWSPSVEDMFDDFIRENNSITPDLLLQDLTSAAYQEGNLTGAVSSANEIMVCCDSYFAMPLSDEVHLLPFLQ